jgi:hypothetical protein
VGDKNQSIYNKVEILDCWNDRSNLLKITGSQRLSENIAKVVQFFGLEYCDIEGRNSEAKLKPHILVFDDNSILKVIPQYYELVTKYQEEGLIPKILKYPAKVIGWRTESEGTNKLTIKSYWPAFSRDKVRESQEKKSLNDYLFIKKRTYKQAKISLNGAIVKVLRIAGVKNDDGKYYTEGTLNKFLKEREDVNHYHGRFNVDLYIAATRLVEGHGILTFKAMKDLITNLLMEVFNVKELPVEVQEFFGEDKDSEEGSSEVYEEPHELKFNPSISTVHSAKGETHTATLYLETYYYGNDKNNSAAYESERLVDPFSGKSLTKSTKPRIKESARMIYVGFSRPTHLLCFAIHKSRWEELSPNIPVGTWEVININ